MACFPGTFLLDDGGEQRLKDGAGGTETQAVQPAMNAANERGGIGMEGAGVVISTQQPGQSFEDGLGPRPPCLGLDRQSGHLELHGGGPLLGSGGEPALAATQLEGRIRAGAVPIVPDREAKVRAVAQSESSLHEVRRA